MECKKKVQEKTLVEEIKNKTQEFKIIEIKRAKKSLR